MAIDQRQHERVSVSIGIVLDFSSGTREARISDLSMGGCFVDSIAKVADGELLSFNLKVSAGKTLRLTGEVVYVYTNVGFGLRFINLTENERALLEEILVANGGKPLPPPERQLVAEEKPAAQQAGTVNSDTTSFEYLKKSIQDELDRLK